MRHPNSSGEIRSAKHKNSLNPVASESMDTKEAGHLGGKRRAARMAPEERREAARKAARARWSIKKKQDSPAIRQDAAATAAGKELTQLIRESRLNMSRLDTAIFESKQVVTRAVTIVAHSRNLLREARIGSEASG